MDIFSIDPQTDEEKIQFIKIYESAFNPPFTANLIYIACLKYFASLELSRREAQQKRFNSFKKQLLEYPCDSKAGKSDSRKD